MVGAGPAGIICACTAAERGHRVTLFEKQDRAGGELIPGSVPKIKYDVANYLLYLNHLLEETAKDRELELRFEVEATPKLLKQESFDAVVTCTGALPIKPPVDGVDLPHVVQAVDLLRDPSRAEKAQRVVVVGGGSVGCEVAYMLAYEMGRRGGSHRDAAALHERSLHLQPWTSDPSPGEGRGEAAQLHQAQGGHRALGKSGQEHVPELCPIRTSPGHRCLPENVKNPLARKIKVEEREVEMEADLVVLAVGLRPDDSLYEGCVRDAVAPEVHNIGDSLQRRTRFRGDQGRLCRGTGALTRTGI